jgi:hypothetical protein
MPTLDISPEKVAWVIVRSREFGAKVAPFDGGADADDADEQSGTILENRSDDYTRQELAAFIRALNEDEKLNLVAMSWIGRGTYEKSEWDRALATARREKINSTVDYLLGSPMLADHLETALDAFGYSVAELEDSVS